MASPSSLPRPPPSAPLLQRPPKLQPPAEEIYPEGTSSSASLSLNPSLLIVSAIVAFVFVASASIHLLLRFLSSRIRSSSVAATPPPLPPPPPTLPPRPDSPDSNSGFSDKDKAALVDSLPLFSLASSLAVLPKSSPDCAVCLSPFRPHDELRLLPACRHAFHSQCVDPWLRSAPSCPLCRTSITLPATPLPPPRQETSTPGSFQVEIGSVSRRETTSESDPAAGNLPPHLRAFSLGSSFEYIVDQEVEAVVSWIPRRIVKEEKSEASAPPEPSQPGAEVAEAAGGGGRGWLSSASSAISSLQLSGRWSHRYDGGEGARWSRDLEGSARREAEEGGYYDFYRWLIGA
ncbi:E3 ubiquitin-protein ligase ATL4-like [Zingiber officinale]|uniref:RING-type domain-containing protein n=1 Tax=Zingiber officinale TaxID=94328 RepID=A0A8J5KVS2_ZINOF|nr:E3 ubiquitin-protein ligase ATL4-like [Zingiber officinale]KAG6494997.1 hypothetical protein ZIOFF_042787 [Zingiber officinale]